MKDKYVILLEPERGPQIAGEGPRPRMRVEVDELDGQSSRRVERKAGVAASAAGFASGGMAFSPAGTATGDAPGVATGFAAWSGTCTGVSSGCPVTTVAGPVIVVA